MPGRIPRAVVFDCDGLMFNTEDVFELTGDELMRRRGGELTFDVRSKMIGRRAPEAFGILVDELSLPDSVPDLMQESKEIFAGFMDEHLAILPGLPELLDHLDADSIPFGVATSSPRNYLETVLDRFGLRERFQFTLTAEDVTYGKPHPEIYRTASEQFPVQTSEMVVFEDSETGTRAAASSGAIAVAVPSRHTRHGDFSVATHVVDSLADPDVYAILRGEPNR